MNEDKSKIAQPPNGVSSASSDGQAGWINGAPGWTGWVQATPEEMAADAAKPVKVLTKEDLVKLARPGGKPPSLYPTKSAKRTFIEFTPAEWTPVQEAFGRMIAVLGSSFVAERDLRNDLLAGRLIGAVRWCTFEDGWEGCERLDPSVWQALNVRARPWPNDATIEVYPGPRLFKGSPGRLFRGHSLDFYIALATLEKRYPLLEETSPKPVPSTAAGHAPETPRLPTYVTKHDWIAIVAEMARRYHDPSGLIMVSKSDSDIAAEMDAWCDTEFGFAPSNGELRDAAKAVRESFLKGPEPAPKKRR